MNNENRKVVSTDKAPQAIGPYSQGIESGCFLFLSGQLGLIPATGEFVKGGIEEQTHQALSNSKSIIESCGRVMSDVVKTTVFLKNMEDFPKMNAVYATFFEKDPPARSTVEVAALPKHGLVEIEAIVKS